MNGRSPVEMKGIHAAMNQSSVPYIEISYPKHTHTMTMQPQSGPSDEDSQKPVNMTSQEEEECHVADSQPNLETNAVVVRRF